MIDVRAYGAVGDGIADDTAAIQAAIDAGPDEVLFPSGTYTVSAELRIPSRRTLILTAATIDPAPIMTARAMRIVPGASGVRIVGGRIGWRVSGAGVGLCIDQASDVLVEDTAFFGFRLDGVWIGGTAQSRGITLRRIVSEANKRCGLSVVNAVGVFVDAGTFRANGPSDPGSGCDVEPNVGEQVTGVTFLDCTFASNARGLYIQQGKGVRGGRYRVIDCVFLDNAQYGLIGSSCDYLQIIGCDVARSKFGVSLGGGARGVTFAENVVRETEHAIVLAGVEDPKLYDNRTPGGQIEVLPAGGRPGVFGAVVMLGNV